ncbi:MAG: DUF455 family protein [Chlamydiae bacterium]|nr:DUF455 family protein [Chlamydiota bacterium]
MLLTNSIITELHTMELREFALQILTSEDIDTKLYTPDRLTDLFPGEAFSIDSPCRSIDMQFKRHHKEEKLPTFKDHHTQEKRAICLHRFCGHELLAVEIMAYALLKFPDAPKPFRKGLANTLIEEQHHVRIYRKRLEEMGLKFGELPLYKHFWKHIPYLTSIENYLSMMSLTFEMANLDFAPLYRDSFLRHNDVDSANLMQKIIDDEIGHVSFGVSWMHRMNKENKDPFLFYKENLPPLLDPKRAKGFVFQTDLRKKAQVPNEWIEGLKNL